MRKTHGALQAFGIIKDFLTESLRAAVVSGTLLCGHAERLTVRLQGARRHDMKDGTAVPFRK
ncbi:MAG TPA: hypothetical protein VN112_12435 [Ensifer sp.]|nr:hypothetical protein [Ensifer sp.]